MQEQHQTTFSERTLTINQVLYKNTHHFSGYLGRIPVKIRNSFASTLIPSLFLVEFSLKDKILTLNPSILKLSQILVSIFLKQLTYL